MDYQTKLQNLQEALRTLLEDEKEVSVPENKKLEKNLKSMEDRFMVRLQRSEGYMTQQLEDNVLAGSIMTIVFVLTSLYLFYILLDNTLRLRRCKCPTEGSWDTVVNAAKLTLAREAVSVAANNSAPVAANQCQNECAV
jgi:hypothetical protein